MIVPVQLLNALRRRSRRISGVVLKYPAVKVHVELDHAGVCRRERSLRSTGSSVDVSGDKMGVN